MVGSGIDSGRVGAAPSVVVTATGCMLKEEWCDGETVCDAADASASASPATATAGVAVCVAAPAGVAVATAAAAGDEAVLQT